jgi:hypothetical protein
MPWRVLHAVSDIVGFPPLRAQLLRKVYFFSELLVLGLYNPMVVSELQLSPRGARKLNTPDDLMDGWNSRLDHTVNRAHLERTI